MSLSDQYHQLMYFEPQESQFYDVDEPGIIVNQYLEPEQYQYEFPSKTCLKALAYLDEQEQEYSFFDQSSFSTAIESANTPHADWHEMNESLLVDDGGLSPLQLPAQVKFNHIGNKVSSSSPTMAEQPVGPSSFLSEIHKHHMYHHVTPARAPSYMRKAYSFSSQEDLQIYCNEAVPILEDSDSDITSSSSDSSDNSSSNSSSSNSVRTNSSRVVLIKLNKQKNHPSPSMTFIQRCPTSLTYFASDEGYDDDDMDKDEELESHCVFYPLDSNEDTDDLSVQDRAAVKIQALWRGYRSRCHNKRQFSTLRADQRVFLNLAQLSTRMHSRQMNKVDERLHQLEQRLHQETTMRLTFEKAMENMAVLIDQQQKALYDRLEQEVQMRQVYEEKMNTALAQLQPLESRLRKEMSARAKMEEMMTRVLDQMHQSETSRLEQEKEDAEAKKAMQAKLDFVMEEITSLKKQANNTPTRKPLLTSSNNSNNSRSANATPLPRRPITASTTPSILSTASTASSSSSKRASSRLSSASPLHNNTMRRQQTRNTTTSTATATTTTTKSLLERPSVVPSIRRQPLDQQKTPVRRTFLSRK